MFPLGCFNSSASSICVFPYFPVSLSRIYLLLYNPVWRETACLTLGANIHISWVFGLFVFLFFHLSIIKLWCLISRQSFLWKTHTLIFYQFLENVPHFTMSRLVLPVQQWNDSYSSIILVLESRAAGSQNEPVALPRLRPRATCGWFKALTPLPDNA